MKNSGIPLSAFPPHVQEQIRAQMRDAKPGEEREVRAQINPIPAGFTGGPSIRQRQGPELNKTEAAFLEHLKAKHVQRFVLAQSVTLKLANGCRYTPDFFVAPVTLQDKQERACAYEVKGFMRDDAAVKLKVAAALFPWIRFFLASRKGRGHPWRIVEVLG